MSAFYRIKSFSALGKKTLSGYISRKENLMFPYIQKKLKTFLKLSHIKHILYILSKTNCKEEIYSSVSRLVLHVMSLPELLKHQ